MLPVALDCTANQERSGAAGIAQFFLWAFVTLLFVDMILTAFAIWKTIRRPPPQDCIPPQEPKTATQNPGQRSAGKAVEITATNAVLNGSTFVGANLSGMPFSVR